MLPSASLKALKASYFQCSWRRDWYQICFFCLVRYKWKQHCAVNGQGCLPGKQVQHPCGSSTIWTSRSGLSLPTSWWTQLCQGKPKQREQQGGTVDCQFKNHNVKFSCIHLCTHLDLFDGKAELLRHSVQELKSSVYKWADWRRFGVCVAQIYSEQ